MFSKSTKTVIGATLPLIAMSSMLTAARNDKCAPEPPATCNADDCCRTYCLGPENYGVNAPVRPMTCNGDWMFTVAGLYWNSHQDGMQYAVDSHVTSGNASDRINLINANYENPDFKWNFGFKLGLGYNTVHDGWDIGVVWTRYQGKASSHVESESDDNNTLLPLWSNAYNNVTFPLFVTDITTAWKMDLDLIDIDLGREFWVSKYLSLRPHLGVRISYIKQSFEIEHKGGSFSASTPALNDYVDIDNDFKGAGLRGGLETVWNLGCGWAIYGDLAVSLVYGRFDIDHDEYTRQAVSPFSKEKILETDDSFKATRMITDLTAGIQWSTGFCDNSYGFTAMLGWENHLFLDQNQMWRVVRAEGSSVAENVYHQRRGDLDTQGWTLTFRFEF